jgi:nitrogen regulatory protein PII-like uncharacterized protein
MKKSNIIKKFRLILIGCVLLLTFVACSPNESSNGDTGKDTSANENPLATESLSSILDKIYVEAGIETAKLGQTEITTENLEYFLGTKDIEFTEAMASEPLMTSSAHSIVLLRVKEESDIEKIKEDIKTSVDPRKWICVGVEPENVIVDNVGNMVILIMDENSTEFHKAFLELVK